jgi:enoyl-CoA hydratase
MDEQDDRPLQLRVGSCRHGAATLSLIRLDHDGPLAVLSIDNPPLNLFDQELMGQLSQTVDRLVAEPPRGLLIRAEGRVVSGGVDVHVFDGLSTEQAADMWVRLLNLVHRVEELPLPTVFAAHALCLTAAFELSLGCDLLLAAESARFGLVETVVALTPAMGGTQRLAERAGPARARELVMTGELYGAATLERWNVVNRVLPDEGFDAAARAFARKLAEGPTRAHAATKGIVRASLDRGGARGADERVPQLAGDLFATEDLKRAVRSFLERGPGHATYEGR